MSLRRVPAVLQVPAVLLVPAVLVALAACSAGSGLADTGGAPVTAATPTTDFPATDFPATDFPATAPTGPGATPATAATPGPIAAPAGGYDLLPAARALRAYSTARTAAFDAGSVDDPAFVSTVSPAWLDNDRGVVAAMLVRGWTLHGVARWSVLGADLLPGGLVSLRACQWDPSTYFADGRTGRRAEPVTRAWQPYDVRAVRQSGRWVIDAVFDASFSCAGAR